MIRPLALAPALVLVLALVFLGPTGAAAQAPDAPGERLSFGIAIAPSGLDPHGYASGSDTAVNGNIYEGLVTQDAAGRPAPALAVSWTVTDGLIWDFTLREGVTFHDGTPFTAADVLASFERVRTLKTSLRGLATKLHPVTAMEARGPHALRLVTTERTPLLLYDLVKVVVLRASGTAVTEPEAFNSGREAIGTGPFRFAAYAPGARLDLARNDAWWGEAPAWPRVALRFIPRDAARAAALLAGDVDVIERVAPSDAPALAGRPGLRLTSAPGLNTVYVILSLARDDGGPFASGPEGAPLASNPLRDQRVRQALSLAVNRTALTERLLAGAGLAAGQFAPAGTAEHLPEIPLPAQDVARARALLAEAGFPAGLRLVLHSPSDRFTNVTQVVEAVAQMWSRAGVATTVETMPFNTLARRAVRGEFAALLFACCSSTLDSLQTTRDLVGTHDLARGIGGSNYGRYANPALDAVVAAGMASFDPAARRAAALQAAAIVAEDVPVVLLYQPVNTWAARAPVSFEARIDGLTFATGAKHLP